MKPLFLLLAMAATAFGQQIVTEGGNQPSAADITRGRVGGDASRTSTSIRIEGNANQGAGVNTLSGETSNKTLRIEPAAANGEATAPALTVTGASSAEPSVQTDGTAEAKPSPVAVQPVKTSGSTSPEAGATDTGPGAEQ